jgi:hypothetical protein
MGMRGGQHPGRPLRFCRLRHMKRKKPARGRLLNTGPRLRYMWLMIDFPKSEQLTRVASSISRSKS